jgi:hypothetical protein
MEIESEFVERVHEMVWCNVATMDTQGRLRSRILHPIWDRGTGYVGTRRNSLKIRHFEHHPWVSLAYVSNIARPVYADCSVALVEDSATRHRIWDLFKSVPPPLGFDFGGLFADADAPEFALVYFTPWRVQLSDGANLADAKVWRQF